MRLLTLLILVSELVACGRPSERRLPADDDSEVEEATAENVELAHEDDIADHKAIGGSYIVAFRTPNTVMSKFRSYLAESIAHQSAIADRLISLPQVSDINYVTSLDLNTAAGLVKDPTFAAPPALRLFWNGFSDPDSGRASIAKVDFKSPEEAAATLAEWEQQGLIWYAEPNRLGEVEQTTPSKSVQDYVETYKTLETQAIWWQTIKLTEAFTKLGEEKTSTEFQPLIAVLDSGTDIEHPALKNRIWNNDALNQSGCSDDLHGCNATQSKKGTLGNGEVNPATTSRYNEECPVEIGVCRHGTHVAGIIAAEPSTDYGGVCPFCQIVTVKIVGKTAGGQGAPDKIADSSIIAGFTYVTRFTQGSNKAIRLINASFGKFQRSRTVGIMIRLLYRAGGGILVVAAAGNEDTDKREYPGAFDDVLAVANVTSIDTFKHSSSNYGRWVDIAAPGSGVCPRQDASFDDGDGILSTIPGGHLACLKGTSMASPVVAGVAALLVAQNPNISVDAIKERLLQTADPSLYQKAENSAYFPRVPGERFQLALLGQGVVNAANAINNKRTDGRPATEVTNRVTSECGAIGGRYLMEPSRALLMMVLLFLIPSLSLFLRQRLTRPCVHGCNSRSE